MHSSTDTYKQNLLPPTHPAINEKVSLRIVDSVITMHGFYGTNDPKVKISGSKKSFFTIKRNQSEIIKVSTVRVSRRYYITQKDKDDRNTLEVGM